VHVRRAAHVHRWGEAVRAKHMVIKGTCVVAVALALLAPMGHHVLLAVYSRNVLQEMHGTSMLDDVTLRVGQVFDFGVTFKNESMDRVVIVRSVSFPHGLPANVSLIHESIMSPGGFLGSRGWPPQGKYHGHAFSTRRPEGFVIKANGYATVGLAFVAHAPGAYVLGPVRVRVDVPGPLGALIPVEVTYGQYGEMCIHVSRSACTRATAGVPGSGLSK